MIKLLTLKNVSPYAEDALFKICLNLDKFTLTEDTDYENYEDLLEKVLYYIKHDTAREKIALSGYEKVKEFHTYEKRVEEILQVIG